MHRLPRTVRFTPTPLAVAAIAAFATFTALSARPAVAPAAEAAPIASASPAPSVTSAPSAVPAATALPSGALIVTVTQTMRDAASVNALDDATVTSLDGGTIAHGVKTGDIIPDGSTLGVPVGGTIAVTTGAGSTATLEGGASDVFFVSSASSVILAPLSGKTNVDDVAGTLRIANRNVTAFGKGASYSIDVQPKTIAFDCTNGTIVVTRTIGEPFDESDDFAAANPYVERVDTLGAGASHSYRTVSSTKQELAGGLEADQAAAAAGSTEAEANLGARYLFGIGVAANASEAESALASALLANDAAAEVNLGVITYYRNTPSEQEKAARFFTLAADQGSAPGELMLSRAKSMIAYFAHQKMSDDRSLLLAAAAQGDASAIDQLAASYASNVPADPAAGLRWQLLAATMGFPSSQSHVASLFELGSAGVPINASLADLWNGRAAAAGDADAEDALANVYELGRHGHARDFALAAKWARLAAKGNIDAADLLGYDLGLGLGVPRDVVAARHWYGESADHGGATAMSDLGYFYEHGIGVKRDYKIARQNYNDAVFQGRETTYSHLGEMAEHGEGEPRDLAKALTDYRLAAAAGSGPGAASLGRLYENGIGVRRDLAAALTWDRKAASVGAWEGAAALEALYANGRGVKRDPVAALSWAFVARAFDIDPEEDAARLASVRKASAGLSAADRDAAFASATAAVHAFNLRFDWNVPMRR